MCRRCGSLIHVTTHHRTYDMQRPCDWRTLADDGVDSAYEVEKTSHRIRRDIRANALEGRPHGKVLYGYRRVYDSRTGRLTAQVVDQSPQIAISSVCVGGGTILAVSSYTKGGVVDEAATRYASGESQRSIVSDFNSRGIPAPEGGPAHIAHVYHYAQGGKDGFRADRETLAELLKLLPQLPVAVAANSAFVHRGRSRSSRGRHPVPGPRMWPAGSRRKHDFEQCAPT